MILVCQLVVVCLWMKRNNDNVNLQVDVSDSAEHIPDVKLVDIPEKLLPKNFQKIYKLKCLSVNGRSPALTMLVDWARRERADFNKIIKVLKMVSASKEPLKNPKHVKTGSKPTQKEIYEVRADKGSARLFFFYVKPDEIVICTNTYWKTDGSVAKQNSAFDVAAQMRELYLKSEVQDDQ